MGKNTPGTQAAEKMNGHCYVLLSLYNFFSPWWKYDRPMIQTVHTVTSIWCISMEFFLSICCFYAHLKFVSLKEIPTVCVCVYTILAALDMSHIKWLYFRLVLQTHTHSQTHTYLSHIALENLLEFICR